MSSSYAASKSFMTPRTNFVHQDLVYGLAADPEKVRGRLSNFFLTSNNLIYFLTVVGQGPRLEDGVRGAVYKVHREKVTPQKAH